MTTTFRFLSISLAVLMGCANAFAQNGRPDLSQLPPGSNNMFPPIPVGSGPSATTSTPFPNSYQATPVPQAIPQFQPQQFQQAPSQSYPPADQNVSVPFDPSQFRGFNPNQGPTQQPRNLPPQQPREEKFVPSEVVSGLPPAKMASDLRAVLRTSMGDITIKLDKVKAPMTVSHFIALARGDKEFVDVKTSKRVKRPFYNGLIFHRVVKGFLIQTGCPFGNGRGGPGDIATIPDEIKPGMKFLKAGLVAMAPMREKGVDIRKDSNGSQFFITLREMPDWDEKFTIFGEIEEGMDVVQKIANVKVGPTERPVKRVYLNAIDIFEGTGDQQQQIPAVPPPNPDQFPPAQ